MQEFATAIDGAVFVKPVMVSINSRDEAQAHVDLSHNPLTCSPIGRDFCECSLFVDDVAHPNGMSLQKQIQLSALDSSHQNLQF